MTTTTVDTEYDRRSNTTVADHVSREERWRDWEREGGGEREGDRKRDGVWRVSETERERERERERET